MKIVCPHCNFSREVADEKIPDRPVKVTCPQCHQGFAFHKAAAMAGADFTFDEAAAADTSPAASRSERTVCPTCGLEQPAGDSCAGCGAALTTRSAPQTEAQPAPPGTQPEGAGAALPRVICHACGTVQHPASQCISCGVHLIATVSPLQPTYQFAGFWIRFVAYLIDTMILGAVQFAITLALRLASGGMTESWNGELAMTLVGGLCGMVISLTYAVFFTGYHGQTPGKMALRIQVIRSNGTAMTYGRAFLREVVGKFVSGIILGIGYLMAAFDAQKQALHDRIAGTYVIKL